MEESASGHPSTSNSPNLNADHCENCPYQLRVVKLLKIPLPNLVYQVLCKLAKHIKHQAKNLNLSFNCDTPWKINMEPTNRPFGKEHDLPNLQGIMFHVNLQGCNQQGKNTGEDEGPGPGPTTPPPEARKVVVRCKRESAAIKSALGLPTKPNSVIQMV